MLPSRHIIVSLPLGAAVGFFTESFFAGLLCFFCGVLIDIDHLIEYLIHYGLRPFTSFGSTLKEVYQTCGGMLSREGKCAVKKIYLIFHAVELVILLWVVFAFNKNIYLFSIASGYTAHLIMDIAINPMRPSAYFIVFRIKNSFDALKFARNRIKEVKDGTAKKFR